MPILTRVSTQERLARIEAVLEEREKAIGAALASAKEATTKAEAANNHRFDGVNEFRAALADQAARLMPRETVEVALTACNARIDAVEGKFASCLDRGEYAAQHEQLRQALDAHVKTDLDSHAEVLSQLSALSGAATGQARLLSVVFALIGAMAVVASVIINVVK